MTTSERVAAVLGVMRRHGLDDYTPDNAEYDWELHGWRCEHVEMYGGCTCATDLARDIVAALNPA